LWLYLRWVSLVLPLIIATDAFDLRLATLISTILT
jgi:hypothetical protein